jgi:plastocyanin
MRPLLVVLVVALVAAVPATAAAKTRNVKVGDNYFVRPGNPKPTVKVRKGTVVRWNWTGSHSHNVVASGPSSFQSALKRSGHFSKRVKKRGTYTIICQIHSGMKMKLKVT